MTECDRCGRTEANGATVNSVLDGQHHYCAVCIDWYNEHGGVRSVEQASMEDYA